MAKKEITYQEYLDTLYCEPDTVVKVTEEELSQISTKAGLIGIGFGIFACGLGLLTRCGMNVYTGKKYISKNTDKFVKDNLGK